MSKMRQARKHSEQTVPVKPRREPGTDVDFDDPALEDELMRRTHEWLTGKKGGAE